MTTTTTSNARSLAVALSALCFLLASACAPGSEQPDAGAPDAGQDADAGQSDDDAGQSDDDAGSQDDDAGSGEDDAGPPPPGPSASALEHLGAYLPAANVSLLTSASSERVLFGYQGVPVPPSWIGHEGEQTAIPTGLLVLDRASGRVTRYDDSDGLPSFAYGDVAVPAGSAAAPLFDLEWLVDGQVFVAAAWTHVVRGTFAEDGSLSFTSATLPVPSSSSSSSVLVPRLAYAGGKLFAASDHGVALLDPTTLALTSWIDLGIGAGEGDAWVYELSVASLADDVVAVLAGPVDAAPTHVVFLQPNAPGVAPSVSSVEMTDGAIPLSVASLRNRTLVGVMAGGEGEIRSIERGPDGLSMTTWATAAELSTLSGGGVIPGQLAYDLSGSRMLVGGLLRGGSLTGGGLGQILVDDAGLPTSTALDLVDRRDRYRELLPSQVDVLVVDARGDVYVSGRNLCSESRLGRVAPLRIERVEGETRLVRPFLSGVRTLAVGGPGEELWVGHRDELPGLVCEGVNVAQGICRLRADGACEIYTPVINSGDGTMSAAPGPSGIAFGDEMRREMAVATTRDALFLREGEASLGVMTQIDPGLNLNLTSIAYGEPGALWLGSEMHYEDFPDETLDDEAINRRGPHGLGYLELDETARITLSRRYVRDASDLVGRDEVAGLWSDWVWDVLPLEGARKAVVALGPERVSRTYDHLLPALSPRDISGGVALIDDEVVQKVAAPNGFDDVVALARGPSQQILALDANSGVYRIDAAAQSATRFAPAPWSAPERGLSLDVDEDGRIAVGSTRGLWVYDADGGRSELLGDGSHGYVWTVRFHDDGVLYAGTDQGLVRIALDEATLPTRGPEQMTREIWELSWGCWGEAGCTCSYDNDCAPSLACGCDEVSCTCQDPVIEEPVGDDCTLDCSCATDSGCPDGQICQGGFAGFSCL